MYGKDALTKSRDFLNVFYRLHNFDQILYVTEIEVDFVIDTDTDRI